MSGNSFGLLFKLTGFGESHGPAIGGVLEGCPAGLELDMAAIQADLDRRKPGQSKISTQRTEHDEAVFLSGIFENKTTGMPIAFIIANKDSRSKDYDKLKDVFRPSHADYTYSAKYGHRDHRGGGRASARETAARVVAGAIARQYLMKMAGIEIRAYVSAVGNISLEKPVAFADIGIAEQNPVRCPDPETAGKMVEAIEKVKSEGDSLGGIITCMVNNIPAGLGEPVFDKLHAVLGHGLLSIPAVKGVEFGDGFAAAQMKGSEHNDPFVSQDGNIRTLTNRSGGIQGGISNGENLIIRIAFKPVATIAKAQQTVDISGKETVLKAKGRHDPCVVPRAVPIVEAMTALALADMHLRNKAGKIN